MKYLIFGILWVLFGIILLPIMLTRWDEKGWDDIAKGLADMCGLD